MEFNGPWIFAQPIDVIGETIGSIRNKRDGRAGQPLGIILKGVAVFGHSVGAVALEQCRKLSFAREAGGHLRVNVTQHLVGHTHVGGNDIHQRGIHHTSFDELQEWQSQPFLMDLHCRQRIASRDEPSDVNVVGDGRRPTTQSLSIKYGADNVDVR